MVKAGKRNVINEAFRVLRTNLGFLSQKDGSNVIMVTSFNPGSGKTFISMNMAVSLAIKNKRVLVIDGDLRRATTSAYINSPETGLSDYLVGDVNSIDAITVCDTIIPGLCVMRWVQYLPTRQNCLSLLNSSSWWNRLKSSTIMYLLTVLLWR